nr:FtsX-like permease family protein [Allopusillimonas soli]
MRLLALAVVLAVACVASVGFLADRLGGALERDSAQLVGGDLVLRSGATIPKAMASQALERGLSVARTVEFPSMVGHGQAMQLAALKAVTPDYPLRGSVLVASEPGGPARSLADGPPTGAVWVDEQVLAMLGARVGDALSVGNLSLRIAGVLAYEPDRGMRFINMAPRVMMRMDELADAGLLGSGSRVTHYLLAAGEPKAIQAYRTWLVPRLEPGQRIVDMESSGSGMRRTFDRARQFLSLVAVLTVMIAGVAVALAARRYAVRHQDGVAVMRCMGASGPWLSRMLCVAFAVLGLLASLAGVALGYLAHQGLVLIVAGWFDAPLPPPSPRPALLGMATGLLLLLGFALPPLAALRRIAPGRILRSGGRDVAPGRGVLAGTAVLILLAFVVSGRPALAVIVTGGFLAALGVSAFAAWLLLAAVSSMRHGEGRLAPFRLALAGLARRRALTIVQVCALSAGLMIILLLAIMRTDLLQGWQETVPEQAPDTFLINIQPDQVRQVSDSLARAGVPDPRLWPMVRGRLVAINGRPARAGDYQDARARRMIQRDFNLSYSNTLPEGNVMTAGRWLDPDAAEVSIENGLAETLQLKVGDSLRFDVAGDLIDVRISGLREVDWDSFQANFFAVASPAALRDTPASYITAFRLPPASPGLARMLVQQYPNLTVFDVGAILNQVRRVLDQSIQAVQLLFLFTLAAGLLVLGAALLATRDERMHEAALLRALGASRRQLSIMLRVELALLGTMAGLMAAAGAVATALLLASEVFDFSLALSWWPWAAGVAAGVLIAWMGGAVALAGVLRTPPLVSLRES